MSPYEVLGVSISASEAEIRQAYRRAAMKHHPDRGGDAGEFARIQTAYKRLISNKKCPVCNGKGFTTVRAGFFASKINCPRCWS